LWERQEQWSRLLFTQLRTWYANGRVNTPCHDKEIELTLGRLLQLMGGKDNLAKDERWRAREQELLALCRSRTLDNIG